MVSRNTQIFSEANITAENTFSKPITIFGFGNVSVYGETWSGTVTLQRSFNYHDLLQMVKKIKLYG